MPKGSLEYSQMRRILLSLLFPLWLTASPLPQQYPSYRYVLSEFDIDTAYIYDPTFEAFARTHAASLRHFYHRSIKRGRSLLSYVRGELLEDGLSDLFLYLSIVESGLTSDITSFKKAAGLWQFMPQTARAYDLQVCDGIDERCDPFSSTRAAIRHLKRLHARFGKWYLAILAYNCGEGCVQKAIGEAHTDELEVLLDDQARYLPKETREYLKKIILIAMIGEEEQIDFGSADTDTAEVEVAGGTDLNALAKALSITLQTLYTLNPQFKQQHLPKKRVLYKLRIPDSVLAAFYLSYQPDTTTPSAAVTEKEETKPLLSHTVKLGDTLESLAKQYHTSAEEIREKWL
jgi:membrane-bound lytic murein transglycosylase D